MLAALIQMYRRMKAAAPRPSGYRPERHYMRGAGPASRRKAGAEDGRKRAKIAPRKARQEAQKEQRQARRSAGPQRADQA